MSPLHIIYGAVALSVIVSTLTLLVARFIEGGGETCWFNGEHISHNEYKRRGGE